MPPALRLAAFLITEEARTSRSTIKVNLAPFLDGFSNYHE